MFSLLGFQISPTKLSTHRRSRGQPGIFSLQDSEVSPVKTFDLKQCPMTRLLQGFPLCNDGGVMRFHVVLILLLVGTASWLAPADTESDCRRSVDPVASIRACSEIIVGSAFGPEQKAEAFRRRGSARAAAGAHEDALRDLDSAIKLKPDNAAAYAARGQVRLSYGDNLVANGDLAEAVRLDPRSAEYLIARGHALLVESRPDDAIADFSAALMLDSKSAIALNNRSLAYRKKGDLDRAISDYSDAISLSPFYGLAFNNRGYAFEAKGRKAEALADFRQALMIDPALSGAKDGLRRLGLAGDLARESEAFAQKGKALAAQNCSRCHAIG